MDPIGSLPAWLSFTIPAVAGMVGVVIGAWLSSRRERNQRRLNFIEKQLQLFYSPMQGIREEISIASALRISIQEQASRAWKELCLSLPKNESNAASQAIEERKVQFAKIIDYDNEKLSVDMLPSYRRIAALFKEQYWLAEQDTRVYYPAVLEYVEIWERWMADALPVEVWKKLNHNEENLLGFYRHISETHDRLRSKLQRGFP